MIGDFAEAFAVSGYIESSRPQPVQCPTISVHRNCTLWRFCLHISLLRVLNPSVGVPEALLMRR